MVKYLYCPSRKVPVIFCPILGKLEFSRTNFRKILKYQNFMKIRPVGAELFHADRQTDGHTDGHDEGNSRYSQYCERASHTHTHTHTHT
jgi:hypothetical protein